MTQRTFYDAMLSGHAHRPRAMLALLDVPHERVVMNLAAGEHKRPEFLHLNPLGQVPVFVDGLNADGTEAAAPLVLRDSTAILVYLATVFDPERRWLPTDPARAAQVQAWLATSSHDVFDGPCAARLNLLFGAPFDHARAVARAHALFTNLFEPHLTTHDWLVGDAPTIADVANYGYIAAAHEGGIALDDYPHLRAWLARLESVERFVPMPRAADVRAAAG